MAEDKNQAKKRIVKNPETFRERAIKASEQTDTPTRRARLRGLAVKGATPFARPVASAAQKTSSFGPFRLLMKPLRLIGRILVPGYLRNSWKELRLVQWPNRHETRQLTFAVLVFAFIFGALVAGVDYGLDKAFKQVLLK